MAHASRAPIDIPETSSLTLNGFLLRVLGVVVVTHLLIFGIYKATIKKFDERTSKISESTFSLPQMRGDPRLSKLTAVVANNPCEFVPQGSGCSTTLNDSDAVQVLQKQQLPPETRKLIENRHFASAYNIARDLLVEGAEQETLTLLRNDVFDREPGDVLYKANFADKWYLLPAIAYVAHDREYDAIVLFKKYLEIMRIPVANKHWLSTPGLDATDLPVLADTFCALPDQLSADECLLGLLKVAALAYSSSSQNLASENPDKHPDLLHVYNSLPASLTTDPLRAYFGVWAWDGHTQPEPAHGNVSDSQLAAWNYAIGIRILEAARATDDCAAAITQSQSHLTQVGVIKDQLGYFAVPAQHRLDFIEANRDKICNKATQETTATQ